MGLAGREKEIEWKKKKVLINRIYVVTFQIRSLIDEECIHLQMTCSSVFVHLSYLIKEHSFKHGWDMNEVNGISSQSF